MVPFSFAGHDFLASPDGALHWPAERALLVADLHLEKASWFARLGQFLPPYDSARHARRARTRGRAQRRRRASIASATASTTASAATACPPRARDLLTALTARLDWVWIVGNHDAGFVDHCGGRIAEEVDVGGIVLRHEADARRPAPRNVGPFPPQAAAQPEGPQRLAPLLRRDRDQADPARLRRADRRARRRTIPRSCRKVGPGASALVPVTDRLLRFPIAA